LKDAEAQGSKRFRLGRNSDVNQEFLGLGIDRKLSLYQRFASGSHFVAPFGLAENRAMRHTTQAHWPLRRA
jgi:hypothetical protein